MKELRPVKETYYLLDKVSEDNLEDDLKKLTDEINKYGLFLEHYQLGMETSLSPNLANPDYTLHLSYETNDQQKKEFNFALDMNLVIRNDLKKRKTDIVILNSIGIFGWDKGYYQFGDQYLVPASSL